MRKIFPIVFCLLVAACNMPTPNSDEDLNSEAATIIAMTLEAEITATQPAPLSTSTLALTSTSTPTITPTYSVPLLKVNESTNCRTGPGQGFEILTTLQPDVSAVIIGRYPVNNYWVVQVEGVTEPCWLWGEYSTITGSYWVVPSVTPPAPATAVAGGQPTNLRYQYQCEFNGVNSDITVSLTWNDGAEGETAYRVFRNSALVAELPANSTSYSETTAASASQTLTYSVAAFNAAGELGRASMNFSCQ